MKSKSLLDSPRYKRFVSDRDRALEQILLNSQTDVSRILFEALFHVEQVVSQLAIKANAISSFQISHAFEQQMLDIFSRIIYPILDRIKRMRRASYTLSHLGELEAIGQATRLRKSKNPREFKTKLSEVEDSLTLADQQLDKRIWIALMRIRAKILDKFRVALIQELSPHEIVDQVKSAFPRITVYKKPPRSLKPIREADTPDKDKKEFSFDFIDEDDWKLAVDAFKDTELPPSRFDTEAEYDPEVGYAKYSWEVEQEMTEDFVKQVRAGQIDAANDLGIKDFVWVAILDDSTDECCRDRFGKTSSEIEAMLKSGELDATVCDALVPPAHYACRCMPGPIANTDPVEGPDWKSFNDWLNS